MGIEGPPGSLGCRGLEQDCLPAEERIALAPAMNANEFWLQTVCGVALVVVLAALAGFYAWRQIVLLRSSRMPVQRAFRKARSWEMTTSPPGYRVR